MPYQSGAVEAMVSMRAHVQPGWDECRQHRAVCGTMLSYAYTHIGVLTPCCATLELLMHQGSTIQLI